MLATAACLCTFTLDNEQHPTPTMLGIDVIIPIKVSLEIEQKTTKKKIIFSINDGSFDIIPDVQAPSISNSRQFPD